MDKDRIKILVVISSLGIGGAEKLVAGSIGKFNTKDMQADLLLLDGSETPFLNRLEKQGGVKIFSLGKDSPYNPWNIIRIVPFLKRYNLVHVHLFPPLYLTALAKLVSRSKTPLVYTEHSTSNRRRNSLLYGFLDKFIYSQYSKIVTISKDVDEALKAHLKFENSCFQLIRNGVDLQTIENAAPIPRNFFPNEENNKLVMQVSSFRYPKDQATLIKAMALLPENIHLLLVGEGPLKTKCEQLAREFNVSDRIRFLGLRMDVPRLLKTVDIVVLSSRREGLSLSSVEGLASGKPFIATDAPGLREVVEGAGLLFRPGNENELATHITDLLNNQSYYTKIAEGCLRRSKKFNLEKTIADYIQLYKIIMLN